MSTALPRIAVIGTGGTISSLGANSLDVLDYPDFGQKLTGKGLGAVRPPLIGLTAADEQALAKLIAAGLEMIAGEARPNAKTAAAR